MADLDAIFKAYDIRGITPDQLDADVARALGEAFAVFVAGQAGGADRVLVGRDMRPSGVELAAAFADGVRAQGLDVVDLGLASTDLVYFAAGKLDAPGAMFTASHNPAQYNGIKLCLAGARPIGEDSGLAEIKAMAASGRARRTTAPPGGSSRSTCSRAFADHVRSFIDVAALAPAQGGGRHRQRHGRPGGARRCSTASRSTSRCSTASSTAPSRTIPPTRSRPENLRDLQARVLEVGADVGLAFDGDADRVFLVDELGAAAVGLHHHRHRRGRRARQAPRRHDPAQLHLLQGGARGRARARRHAGAHQGRAQLHQGGDGRDRRRLRRRALRALLLPRQLARRLRFDRRAARARAARQGRACRCPSSAGPSTATRRPARSTAGRRSGRGDRAGGRRLPGRRPGPPRRPHRRPRRLVVQPPGRRTPSPCSDSTSRRRMRQGVPRHVAEVQALIDAD